MKEYDSREDTLKHIARVGELFGNILVKAALRIGDHDKSKLESPEKEVFDKYTPKLKNSEYGSDEYKQFLKGMKKALDHHYANNRHHPEHFENGVNDMNLIDLIEMIVD